MESVLNAIFSNKESISFFIFGVVGGAGGVVIRAARLFTTGQSTKFFNLVDFVLIFVYALVGGFIALCVGVHIALSLCLGLFAPLVYDILEKNIPALLAGLVTRNLPTSTSATSTEEKKG
jgi:hypothetical protein